MFRKIAFQTGHFPGKHRCMRTRGPLGLLILPILLWAQTATAQVVAGMQDREAFSNEIKEAFRDTKEKVKKLWREQSTHQPEVRHE